MIKYVLFIASAFLSLNALAFPDLSRHGYVNCTACHISPSGGGILNEYGREISKELLSRWSKDGEQAPFYGLMKTDEKFQIAAFVRGLQLHRETATVKEGRPILMQADIEGAYMTKSLSLVATIGRQQYRTSDEEGVRPFSRRHFLTFTEEKSNFRFGRFQRFFGINDPNHTVYTRRDLGFGQDTEGYNLEYSFLGESISIFLSRSFGGLQDRFSTNLESGTSLTASYFWADKQKVGVNLFSGEDTNQDRTIGGIWGILSIADKLFIMSEVDYQDKKSKASGMKQYGYVTTNKISYEVARGAVPYLLFERADLDSGNDLSKKSGWGMGVQFFPRPHFEIAAQWEKEKLDNVNNSNADVGWLMLNIYL